MKRKRLERAARQAIVLAAELDSRLPACCAVPAEDLFAAMWPLAVRLERLERRARKDRKGAKTYRKAIGEIRPGATRTPAGRDGVLLAAGFRRSARPLPVRMNPCWSRPIGGGSQPVCGPPPGGNVRAVWRRVQVRRLPVLSSLLIAFIFAIPPSQFASGRWKSTSAAALCRGVVV
jgi:hypothetical protein